MGHWADGELLSYDTETDDKVPGDAHLITAALIHIAPGRDPIRWSWVAKPTRPIPDKPAEIHGYTTERAEAEGRDPTEVVAEIRELILARWGAHCPLVIYNAPFDLTVLDRELERHHGGRMEIAGPVIDPLIIDRRADKWRAGERKLEVTARHYRVPLADAHEAYADALASVRLAYMLGTRHRSRRHSWPQGMYGVAPEEVQARAILASGCPGKLHAAQISWYRDSSLGLADYWRNDPRAKTKLRQRAAAGTITAEECEELIRTLPERADDVERHADGWPMRARETVSTTA